eukprot:5377563-Amphidinium_carterae.1
MSAPMVVHERVQTVFETHEKVDLQSSKWTYTIWTYMSRADNLPKMDLQKKRPKEKISSNNNNKQQQQQGEA